MQRRHRQHDAEPRQPGGNVRHVAVAARTLAQENDRPFGQVEQARLADANLYVGRRRQRIGEHHRERLVPAVLALPQEGDGLGVLRVAGQVKAAWPLDGEDLAGLQQGVGVGHDVARDRVAMRVEQRDLRAALRAAVAFGVQAAIIRLAVLGLALFAHGEGLHARAFAIVWQTVADRIARAAVRAVGEGVAPAPAVRREHFTEAIAADGGVLPDHRRRAAAATVEDVEVVRDGDRISEARSDRIDARERWRVLMQALEQEFDRLSRTADFDLDAL